jgi:hypothetical protein
MRGALKGACQLCKELTWSRLADVEIIFAAVSANAIGPLAFVNETAMTIALSQFCIAFWRGCQSGMCRDGQN